MENITDEQLQKMLAEAEERCYNRGRNEQIETQMHFPGVWQPAQGEARASTEASAFEILSTPPVSIWEK